MLDNVEFWVNPRDANFPWEAFEEELLFGWGENLRKPPYTVSVSGLTICGLCNCENAVVSGLESKRLAEC